MASTGEHRKSAQSTRGPVGVGSRAPIIVLNVGEFPTQEVGDVEHPAWLEFGRLERLLHDEFEKKLCDGDVVALAAEEKPGAPWHVVRTERWRLWRNGRRPRPTVSLWSDNQVRFVKGGPAYDVVFYDRMEWRRIEGRASCSRPPIPRGEIEEERQRFIVEALRRTEEERRQAADAQQQQSKPLGFDPVTSGIRAALTDLEASGEHATWQTAAQAHRAIRNKFDGQGGDENKLQAVNQAVGSRIEKILAANGMQRKRVGNGVQDALKRLMEKGGSTKIGRRPPPPSAQFATNSIIRAQSRISVVVSESR